MYPPERLDVRVAFATLGCRLNQFETEGMRHRLKADEASWLSVPWTEAADVYVINSCAVTARAEQKCRQMARSIKRKHSSAKVLLVGCYSQLSRQKLLQFPEFDGILGNEEKKQLDKHLPLFFASTEKYSEVADYQRGQQIAEEWIDDFGDHSRATLKVQEGCNLRCTFCAIWKARGHSRSRSPRVIIQQAQALAAAGYEEIVLAGVHLGHYGRDLAEKSQLPDLLEMLLELVDPCVRFRLSSLDPTDVSKRLISLMAGESRICKYLHLPLQSGSSTVLRRMRRAYSAELYAQTVFDLKSKIPGIGLGVDLITGFPGESEQEFNIGLELLRELPLSFYHVFRYSDRHGTQAESLPYKVDGGVSARRSQVLRNLGDEKKKSFLQSLVGGSFDAIVESSSEDGSYSECMIDNFATVRINAVKHLHKKRINLKVESLENSGILTATMLERPALEAASPLAWKGNDS